MNVQNTRRFYGKILSYFPATIQLGNMWRRQSTTEMLKRKGKSLKRSGQLKQNLQKPTSTLQL